MKSVMFEEQAAVKNKYLLVVYSIVFVGATAYASLTACFSDECLRAPFDGWLVLISLFVGWSVWLAWLSSSWFYFIRASRNPNASK